MGSSPFTIPSFEIILFSLNTLLLDPADRLGKPTYGVRPLLSRLFSLVAYKSVKYYSCISLVAENAE
jgi:hypothetical protein